MVWGSLILLNCGTIYSLVEQDSSDRLMFSGVRLDIEIVVDPPVYPVPIGPGWYFLCIIDTPFSLLADIVVFPYTLISDLVFRTDPKPVDFSSKIVLNMLR